MTDIIDIANDQAEYFLQVALDRRQRPTSAVSAQQAPSAPSSVRIATSLSRYFVSRRSRVVRPASVVRGCGSGGDE
jgi:hypothetical protein